MSVKKLEDMHIIQGNMKPQDMQKTSWLVGQCDDQQGLLDQGIFLCLKQASLHWQLAWSFGTLL